MYPGISIKRLTIQTISRNKVQWATGIALLVHSVGLMGMIWVDRQWFARMTPLNLLIMFFLILWSQEEKKKPFLLFMAVSVLLGFLSEILGVQTGWLFGNYSYGSIMGAKIAGVPLIIGLNWFVVLYSSVATLYFFIQHFTKKGNLKEGHSACNPIGLDLVIGGALLATLFDWVMEPVAVDLGFWKWAGNGHIPLLNYMSWFFISIILLSL